MMIPMFHYVDAKSVGKRAREIMSQAGLAPPVGPQNVDRELRVKIQASLE
jgi:hypothetical protein